MKRFVALLLTLALLLGVTGAMAEPVVDINDYIGITKFTPLFFTTPGAHFTLGPRPMYEYELLKPTKVSARLIDVETETVFTTFFNDVQLDAGTHTLLWDGLNDQRTHPAGEENDPNYCKYRIEIVVGTDLGSAVHAFDFTYGWMHSIEDDLRGMDKWYPDNTICVAGLEFREVKPGLTDKWYNFVPIDLSKDGLQSFDLVAGNLNIIGKVNVFVEGDQVTVEWRHVHDSCCDANFMSKREFFTFFSDLNAVDAVEPEQLEGFKYGTPISIANDLGGDTNVLLYVNNMATYCSNYCNLTPRTYTRYWRNLDWRIAAREAMTQLMEADSQ